ncbi:MAG: hypothetical protein NC247_13375 [Ruminococcus flavefaciens]|nr:hypothetical protein [Ruminococcus flavefaciens]MCM1362486.1 hypothetical protein [Clostridiales bacterium]
MLYHGFYVKITPLENIQRERKDGNITNCKGFQIEIFSDQSEEVTVDVFTAAVGFEILKDSVSDAEQFAMDVIESEEKEYMKMIQEFSGK